MSLDISLRLLQAFLALDECRHFTRAAARCHVSQSTFSAMIRKLEEAAGVRLFDRDTRKVLLTPEGEVFADVARRLVAEVKSAFTDLRDHAARRKGRVALAALPSLAAGWLPPVIASYRRRYPCITVELFDSLSDPCLDLVRKGKADLALTAPSQNLAEFEMRPFYSDRFFLVCHRPHPLAQRARIRLPELAGCEFIHLARTSSVRQHLDAALRSVPLVSSGLEVEHLATVAGLVASELGVTLVPELTLFQFRHPDLVVVPVDEPQLLRPILIVKRKGRGLSIAAQGMLEWIEARIAEHRGDGDSGRAGGRPDGSSVV